MHAAAGEERDVRLLWYLTQAHGTGPAYRFITITAVRDAGAWETLSERIRSGDLQRWMAALDTLRYDVTGKLLNLVSWSPLQDLDLVTVPTDGRPIAPGPAPRSASHRDAARHEEAGFVPGGRPDLPRPLGEPAAADKRLVSSLLSLLSVLQRLD
jgi:hypothetical protein